MDPLVQAVGRLLSKLHAASPIEVCPGDWAWTTTLAGGLIGLLPMLGAMLVAFTRRWTGNRYDAGTIVLFGAVGLTMTAVLPWLGFRGVSDVFRGALRGQVGAVGLRRGDLATLGTEYCFAPPQVRYLGGSRTVREVLGSLSEGRPAVLASGLLLAVLPLLAMVFVYSQSRLAVRRGPTWPARLLWLPMLLLMLGTPSMSATVVAHLWLGFLPVTVLGLLAVALVGPPPRSLTSDGAVAVPTPVPDPSGRRPYGPSQRPPADAGSPWPAGPAPGGSPATRPGIQPAGRPERAERPGPPTLPASRFRRIRPLGSGGFGTVWLAMDTALDRTVAIKAAMAPDAETERRIRREAKALAAVHHPNCVRIYDILTDADGGLALIMEYVPGRSLSAAIEADGPLPDPAAARLWCTLAGALHAAHAQGVLHRDVKPSNVVVDESGHPHLIDFGIAKATGDVTLTVTGTVLGTPDYLPPEVAAGSPASPASDTWQLAATISFALAGIPPRGHRDGPVAAMLASVRGEPCNQLPAWSAHRGLLQRALHPDPVRRPDLPTVQAELNRWLAATSPRPDASTTERLHRLPPSPTWPAEDRP